MYSLFRNVVNKFKRNIFKELSRKILIKQPLEQEFQNASGGIKKLIQNY